MRQKSNSNALSSEEMVKGIRRATRKRYSAEDKIRIVLDGLRGEHSIAELCRREGVAEGPYFSWSKEVLEARKRRLAGEMRGSRPRILRAAGPVAKKVDQLIAKALGSGKGLQGMIEKLQAGSTG